MHIAVETLLVGCAFTVIFVALHFVAMRIYGDGAMMQHSLLFLQVFLCGAIGHVLFELFGANDAFCKSRDGAK